MSQIAFSLSTAEHPRVVWLGDSIFSTASFFVTPAQAVITAAYAAALPAAAAPRVVGLLGNAGVPYNPRDAATPLFINSGVTGNVAADIDAAWLTRVGQYGPTHVMLLIGSNDAAGVPTGVGAATAGAAFQASVQSIINKTLAAFPRCKFWIGTPPYYFENWPTGANPRDSSLDDYQTRLRTVVATMDAANPGQFALVDWRNAHMSIAPVVNPGHLTTGVQTDGSGLHPSASGTVTMVNAFTAQLVYT